MYNRRTNKMRTIRIKLPSIDQVEFSIDAEADFTQVRGNALVSGNDAEDKKCEDNILRKLRNGNVWAWALVKVTASYKGLEAIDYLGCCSYKDEKDFIENSGYYEDMKQTTYNELIDQMKALK